MKKILALSLMLSLCFSFVQAQTFQHDMEKSLASAQNSQKNVLLIFSGSDWCKPCINLRKSIIESDEFVAFSDENLVLLEVDFPYRKKNQLSKEQQLHNEKLANQYNQEGSFPKVLLLNAEKKILGQIRYQPHLSPAQFIEQIKKASIL